MFGNQQQRLLEALEPAHSAYYEAETFGGPSLYFHQKCLEAGRVGDCERFAELAYATLASWGMHRMGRGGSKMRDFACFEESLRVTWPLIQRLQGQSPDQLDSGSWGDLEYVFTTIRCMKTATSLVGNSKVMAHALPNLIPPVDREYTLRFLFGNTNITNDIEKEWHKLKSIVKGFFYPVLRSDGFQTAARRWMQQPSRFAWDTSELKVVDNVVIGLMKMEQADSYGSSKDYGRRR